MKVEKVIPILRIFDYAKALEFYRDWLGKTFYGALSFTVNGPFNNRISFNEKIEENK